MLRGINVSGQKLIKMPELKLLFENLGFTGVITYIQSGNVIFSTEEKSGAKNLASKIEKAILIKFGFDVPVIMRTTDELTCALKDNPFQNTEGFVPDKIYITFLEEEPDPEKVLKINPFDFKPDTFIISKKEIYINCASGYGTTKLSNTFFESRLKVRATTRNWKTVNNLVELAKSEKS
jgi:uncharacterized protein (DUF1697 family)